MRTLNHPATEDISLSAVLYALSDNYRLEIIRRLAGHKELTCGGLALPVAKSTLSHHFKVLREAGLIYSRTEGRECYNSLRQEDLEQRFPGLLSAVLAAAQPLV
ncbi:MAG: helix-turn-helix transcriptional regulator [Leptolyngbyaceae cyanobacterium SM1_1_3]|nr:helix-turn-helix transcriptional regulator [Leptolyngbyaceae cyanobacterium SM1_1_3]NJN02413.1 helix-turn-helix transcriptional regulator [Leptolyngbyaceae cyanobacterium RM1_1_2]NJO11084.1 helix-turn-helix transcriptional regulator [Leptolyngbyaceae cyanobacterium SL_1_1]